MTDKDRKARNERVKLRRQVEELRKREKYLTEVLEETRTNGARAWDTLKAKHEQLQACYDTLCAGLGRGDRP